MIKEAEEEAGLEASVSAECIPAGLVSYYFTSQERGNIADIEFIFDLELPIDVVPQPKDGEVECFYLWDCQKVLMISLLWKKLTPKGP